MLNVHHTKSGKYIQKVKEPYFITQQEKSARQLVFGKDMIWMSNILQIGSISVQSKQRFIKKVKTKKQISSPSYLSRHDKVMMRKGTGNKYELPCCALCYKADESADESKNWALVSVLNVK
jgi:hypothetical protein